jgi:integrase/recombinase XerD
VRRFTAWLVEEGEQDTDPLLGLKGPKIEVKVVGPLTDDRITALLAVCSSRDMRDRRDEALVRGPQQGVLL